MKLNQIKIYPIDVPQRGSSNMVELYESNQNHASSILTQKKGIYEGI